MAMPAISQEVLPPVRSGQVSQLVIFGRERLEFDSRGEFQAPCFLKRRLLLSDKNFKPLSAPKVAAGTGCRNWITGTGSPEPDWIGLRTCKGCNDCFSET